MPEITYLIDSYICSDLSMLHKTQTKTNKQTNKQRKKKRTKITKNDKSKCIGLAQSTFYYSLLCNLTIVLVIYIQSDRNCLAQTHFRVKTSCHHHDHDLQKFIASSFVGVPPADDWPRHGAIVFDNVTVRYAEDLKPILHNINLTIHPREKVLFKSTQ